jgi:lipopolysaccharide assembly outer membrane protein LptD (OstA)
VADVVEVYPEVGWHQTFYFSDAEGFEGRGLLTGRADVRTRLRRDYGRVSHLFEPRLGWAFVSDVSQSSNPLYVPATAVPQQRLRELDLDNVTRDTADRIDEFNGLSLAFGNRVYRRPGETGGAARLLADFTLSGLYDFADGEFGAVYLDGRAYPFGGATARFNVGFDPSETHVTEGLAALAWQDRRGDRFTFGYRFLRDVPRFFEAFPRRNDRFDNFREEVERINQLDGGVRIAVTEHWALTYRGAFTFETNDLLANEGGVEYLSRCRCWAVRVEVSGSRARGAQINVLYTLVGLGDDSRTPFDSESVMPGWGLLDGP